MIFNKTIKRGMIYSLLLFPLLFVGCSNTTSDNTLNNTTKVITDLTGTNITMKADIERIAIVPIP